jgi:hypothetical protein
MPNAKHFSMLRDEYLRREFPKVRRAMQAKGTLQAHLEQFPIGRNRLGIHKGREQ